MEWNTQIRTLKGIGDAKAAAFAKLGIVNLYDLLSYFPARYEDRTGSLPIVETSDGQEVCITAVIAEEPRLSRIRQGLELVKFRVADDTGTAEVTYFNQRWVKNSVSKGEEYVFYGKMQVTGRTRSLTNPVYEKAGKPDGVTGRIIPVYRICKGLNQKTVLQCVRAALDRCRDSKDCGDFKENRDSKDCKERADCNDCNERNDCNNCEECKKSINREDFENRADCKECKDCIDRIDSKNKIPELIPETVLRKYDLCANAFAYENIHFPADQTALERARRKLAFEEFFLFSCAAGLLRKVSTGLPGTVFRIPDLSEFLRTLPFSPTGAQSRAIREALKDLSSGVRMNRLVQGDVGSGKTLVAAALIWIAFRNGCSSVFMAPTEILAEQHAETMRRFLSPFGIPVVCLTGSRKAAERKAARETLLQETPCLAVGTHALFSKDVEYRRLGLVITDEQHRFGVAQRTALISKGDCPHVLVMSATPIPRTLALMLYGDLDVSVLDELPPGRQKVDTFAVSSAYRARLNGFIRKQAEEGHQTFVVCPMVEETVTEEETGARAAARTAANERTAGQKYGSGKPDKIETVEQLSILKAAEEYSRELQTSLPGLRIDCVHGKMKPVDKETVMARFAAGQSDVLVSTTVIEVGVDVPNATLIVIENAERFGLSQLHQLRGRVGRGKSKSWCILVSDAQNEDALARLKILCKTNDGFQIAEEDLRLRGPGDFLGSRQHGLPELHLADLHADSGILQNAKDAAEELLKTDPALSAPDHAMIREKVDTLIQDCAMFN